MLVNMTIFHFARKLFLPMPLSIANYTVRSLPTCGGLACLLRRKLEVELLDACPSVFPCSGGLLYSRVRHVPAEAG